VRQLRAVTPTAEPGQRFGYCNVGYAVLARLLEQVSGRPFPQVMRTSVLKPMGLTHTFTDGVTARAAGLAEGHTTILGFPVTRPDAAATTRPDHASQVDGRHLHTCCGARDHRVTAGP
jgi:CubicO group peptidase (beta-lactamase class C family)